MESRLEEIVQQLQNPPENVSEIVQSLTREMVQNAPKKSKIVFLNFMDQPGSVLETKHFEEWDVLLKLSLWITAPFGFVLDVCRNHPFKMSEQDLADLRSMNMLRTDLNIHGNICFKFPPEGTSWWKRGALFCTRRVLENEAKIMTVQFIQSLEQNVTDISSVSVLAQLFYQNLILSFPATPPFFQRKWLLSQ